MPICAACGQENPDGFRFCGACGAELSVRPSREQRKTVTIVFCDVSGSTALGEQLDPESLRSTMGRYFEEIRAIIERHGGTVEKFIGDAVMAVFGIPIAHEDDALRAVRAAAEIRDRLESLGAELGVSLSFRTGINTGEVVAGEGETLVTGDAVNVAARLEQAATPGEVLIGAATLPLVRDAVVVDAVEPLDVKGKRERVVAYRLVSVDPSADAFARRHDAPLVGRERERARLVGDFELAVAERACHLFTVLGPAGVGKSRLVAEFLAGAGEAADVLRARCLHYGEDITYWPLVEILLQLGVEPPSVIGASPVDTQLAFRKLLEARAAERPQIVVLDDIQWAEGVFLDLVEHVADWSRDAPILLLCVARPELLELRPGWGGGKLNATTILLEPLGEADCERLVDELSGGATIGETVRRRILAAAGGNPLFLEEMLAMVADGEGSEIVVPPTIQALLQSRLDRLGTDERDVIGRGAVEGEVFHRGVVQELAPEPERDGVLASLSTLVRKDVIRPERATFSDDDAFRFRHLLIRDAAYDALPRQTRAELHERFAEWLANRGDLVELDEVAGYHLEQAYRNREALGQSTDQLAALGARASERLARAARGALGRGDLGAARGLFTRAAALLPEGDVSRLEILQERQWPLSQSNDSVAMLAAEDELRRSAEPRFRTSADVFGFWASRLSLPYPEAVDEVARLRSELSSIDDPLSLAWLEIGAFSVCWSALRVEEARVALERGADYAERAAQPAMAAWFRGWIAATLVFGRTPAEEAAAVLESRLGTATGLPAREALFRGLGRMLACRGEFDRARECYLEGLRLCRDAGMTLQAAASGMGLSFIELRAGEPLAAESALRASVAELKALDDAGFYSSTVCQLAELLIERGEEDEAAAWCAEARAHAISGDLDCVAHVTALEGLLAARRRDPAEGERLGREAVELMAGSDAYFIPALVRLLFARTLAACGKPAEARAAALEALEIYEEKGDRPATLWTRDFVASLG